MFIALFMIAKAWIKPKYLSTDERIEKIYKCVCVYISTDDCVEKMCVCVYVHMYADEWI